MVKAVLMTKVDPTYDDLPEERYHFPHSYLRQIERAVGDWIVYYEPRRRTGNLLSTGGRQAYFATARLLKVTQDRNLENHFYAWITDYLEFDHSVAFREGEFYYENALRKDDGSTNKGAFGRAVRNISDKEYDLIVHAGFSHVLGESERVRPFPDVAEEPTQWAQEFAEEQAVYEPETTLRPLVQQILNRPFRDRAFASAVKSAYGDTCAVTGLKIINGGGRSEVQAAHIRPVAEAGPDSVRNGIALSGTVHWMFDRGLISVDDEYRLLIARDRVPDAVSRIIQPTERIFLPARSEDWPHPQFLKYHREHVFKG
jgi:putative restriction endonuclease